MANFNTDMEKDSIDDNLKLQVTFSNVSSFGEMRGGTPNEAREVKDIRDNFEKLHLVGACAGFIPNDEDIPLVTFKKKKETKFDPVQWKNYQDTQRIMPLQIIDVLASTMITKKPSLYSFNDNNYRFVQIVGTVVSRKSTKEYKLTIGVDDGSGCISCIVDNSESETQHRKVLRRLEETNSRYETMNKEEFLQLASLDNAEFHKRIKDNVKKDALLLALTGIILDHTKKQLEEYPVIADINIGDNIIIVGVVADFMDQRLIFVNHLKRDKNLAMYKKHMTNAINYKLKKL